MKDLIIYITPDGRTSVTLYAKDGDIWLIQPQITELIPTSKQTNSHHLRNILSDRELEKNSVVKYYLTTAADDKESNVEYYSLQMIIALGYRGSGGNDPNIPNMGLILREGNILRQGGILVARKFASSKIN